MADAKTTKTPPVDKPETVTLQRVYRFRMCPTKEQERAMIRYADACRFVWNWALARRKEFYAQNRKNLTAAQQSRELTALRDQEGMGWLKEIYRIPLEQVLRGLDKAFSGFFARRARFPRFKAAKKTRPAFGYGTLVKIDGGRAYVPGVGWVRIKQSRAVEGVTKSASFKQDSCGRWHVAIVARFEMPDVPLPPPDPGRTVGIDAGLKHYIITSGGERVPAPKFFRKMQKKLASAQRVLGRRKAGSKRREKARKRVARIHLKIANQRADFLHKLSTDMIRRHDCICVENLSISGLAKTKQVAKSFRDAAHREFRRQLEYKALWNRKHFVAVGRLFPSSKKCSACGEVKKQLALEDRNWTCDGCGVQHDRDLNAARNIKAEGLRILAAGHADK